MKKLSKVPSTGDNEIRSGSAVTKGVNDTSILMSDKNQTMYLLGSASNTFQNSANRNRLYRIENKNDIRNASNDSATGSATVILPTRDQSH